MVATSSSGTQNTSYPLGRGTSASAMGRKTSATTISAKWISACRRIASREIAWA